MKSFKIVQLAFVWSLFALASTAGAQTPPPVTLAWQQTVTTHAMIPPFFTGVDFDKAGNVWSVAEYGNGGQRYWLIFERDPYGVLINDLTIPAPASASDSSFAFKVDNNGNSYIFQDQFFRVGQNESYTQATLFSYDNTGKLRFRFAAPSGLDDDSDIESLNVDQSGNVYVHWLLHEPKQAHFQILKISPSGQVLFSREYDNFTGTFISLNGIPNCQAIGPNGDLWFSATLVNDPNHNLALVQLSHVDGSIVHEEDTTNTKPNDIILQYFQVNSDGSYYKLDSTLAPNVNADSFVVGFYNASHQVQWQSTLGGVAYELSAADQGHIYVITHATTYDNKYNVVRLDKGKVVWFKHPVQGALANSMGGGVFVPDNASGVDVLGELDEKGNWFYSSGIAKQDTEFHLVNGSVFTYGAEYNGNAPSVITLSRFVQGPALASVSEPTSVVGGQSFTLTVNLNVPAPAGGLLENLTLTGPGTFAKNGGTTLAVAIPANSIKAFVQVNTSAVTAASKISVEAKGQFVVRDGSTAVSKS